MYTVLIPVGSDRGDEAAKHVIDLSEHGCEVEAVVLSVIEASEDADSVQTFGDDHAASADDVAEYLETHDIEATVRQERGEIIAEIMDVADEVDADSIVMVGRNRSPTGKAVFGSTTQEVILTADLPVTVITAD